MTRKETQQPPLTCATAARETLDVKKSVDFCFMLLPEEILSFSIFEMCAAI